MMRERFRAQDGQTTVELLALLPLLLIAALIMVQLQLFVSTANSAEAAARAAALAAREGQDPVAAVSAALPAGDAARVQQVRLEGPQVTVEVAVPLLADMFGVRPWSVTRDATVPRGT